MNEIILGEDKTLLLLCKDSDGRALDLTGMTVTVKLKINGTLTTLSPTVSNPVAGEVTLTLTDVQTAQLALGNLDIDLYADNAGFLTIIQFYKQIKVVARLT